METKEYSANCYVKSEFTDRNRRTEDRLED